MARTEREFRKYPLTGLRQEYRRYLPHIQPDGQMFFVTWKLTGVTPVCKQAVGWGSDGALFAHNDRELDRAERGPLWLADSRVGAAVKQVLLNGETRGQYRLGPWVIMPNHVHILITPEGPLWAVMRDIKSGSARIANRILRRQGTFWDIEYYDRVIRNSAEAARVSGYIERNPVRAGLCGSPEMWKWGSAHCLSVPAVGRYHG